ncbi:hypothetical protein DVH24_018531 [Malus domestica]|uniref:Prolamin-like domain-containing protein n=1 Tax=Malus domestica TaxID=3750 RepID=A0A498KE86_MALDO|nr:hypothetical protein DVH24_018531 [Malus domestica]
MAGLNMFPMMVILLLANCALPTLAHLDDSPAVVECKKHFSIKYAFDVYNYIFKGKKIGDFSCRALVALGKPCHNVFVNSTFTYEHIGNRTAIQARADRYAFDVYNYIFKGKKISDFSCRALVALGKPCHNVFVNSTFTYEHTGNRTAIQARANRPAVVECKKHFSIKYAFDVYNYIFKGKKISDFSCQALVALGRPCHNVFMNNTSTYEHTGNITAIQARADQVQV